MRDKSCLSYVRRHISNLVDGQIFTTRDCLKYGTRQNVDNALYKCVKDGLIIRIVPGVFTRRSSNFEFPSYLEIARIKACAFGKKLLDHGADLAAKLRLPTIANQDPVFYVNGSSSKFQYRGVTIFLTKASNKRMRLRDDNVGQALRALWHAGKDVVTNRLIDKAVTFITFRANKEKVILNKAWLPSWLADHFQVNHYIGPYKT